MVVVVLWLRIGRLQPGRWHTQSFQFSVEHFASAPRRAHTARGLNLYLVSPLLPQGCDSGD